MRRCLLSILAMAACFGNPVLAQSPTPKAQQHAHDLCAECGKVVAVRAQEKTGQGGSPTLIGGGVAGALLGRQAGGGPGKLVEGRLPNAQVWSVTVQYETGAKADFNFDQDPGLAVGDPVRNSGKKITRR